MDKFRSNPEIPREEPIPKMDMVYHALDSKKEEKDILAGFTPEQQAEIKQKQKILSSLAYFIGKDFRIPVELNQSGAGWLWDFKENVIRIDPKTLLERPMDELRYLVCHEGGHRRVSRAEFIPLEEWKQPGFSAMMNFIEDPRNDNFVAESYPKYNENIDAAWGSFFEEERKKLEKMAIDRLGTKPRFVQAGYEYIRQWFDEIHGQKSEVQADLPDEVKAVIRATIESARDSWWRYPSREEADKSEELIKKYARISYEINRDEIWPEFKKLIEADMKDQKMQELFKDIQKNQQGQEDGGGDHGLPQKLKDKLTPEEQKILEEAIKKVIEDAKKEKAGASAGTAIEQDPSGVNKPIDLASLPEGLKQKIKEYIDSLPEDKQQEIKKKARSAIKELEDALNKELWGKLSDDPEKKAKREEEEKKKKGGQQSQGGASIRTGTLPKEPLDTENLRIYKERLKREMNKDENVYEKYRKEVLPIIDQLEAELRQIFVDRRVISWKGGLRSGKRIDIKKRIQEKAKDVPVMESHAWQRREQPDEKDYAISLLVDLSGSMREKVGKDRKIDETFKAVIVLAEVLNRLGINLEIIGFNDEVYEYQKFGQPMSKQIREHMGGMFKEVEDSCCKNCGNEHSETDLGWATKTAAERLAVQKAAKKLIIVLTDEKLAESTKHPRQQFNPERIKKEILEQTDIVPLDLGSIEGKTVEQVIEHFKKLFEHAL